MTNQFLGLARGPIDHNASAVINSIANGAITMGSAVELIATPSGSELLPRVQEVDGSDDTFPTYGIAVGGDTDGVYGDGTAATDDTNRATASAGQGVVVVTQGRCLARVNGEDSVGSGAIINVGDPLCINDDNAPGVLFLATAGNNQEVIARALQPVVLGETDIIAVDIQREGVLS